VERSESQQIGDEREVEIDSSLVVSVEQRSEAERGNSQGVFR